MLPSIVLLRIQHIPELTAPCEGVHWRKHRRHPDWPNLVRTGWALCYRGRTSSRHWRRRSRRAAAAPPTQLRHSRGRAPRTRCRRLPPAPPSPPPHSSPRRCAAHCSAHRARASQSSMIRDIGTVWQQAQGPTTTPGLPGVAPRCWGLHHQIHPRDARVSELRCSRRCGTFCRACGESGGLIYGRAI